MIIRNGEGRRRGAAKARQKAPSSSITTTNAKRRCSLEDYLLSCKAGRKDTLFIFLTTEDLLSLSQCSKTIKSACFLMPRVVIPSSHSWQLPEECDDDAYYSAPLRLLSPLHRIWHLKAPLGTLAMTLSKLPQSQVREVLSSLRTLHLSWEWEASAKTIASLLRRHHFHFDHLEELTIDMWCDQASDRIGDGAYHFLCQSRCPKLERLRLDGGLPFEAKYEPDEADYYYPSGAGCTPFLRGVASGTCPNLRALDMSETDILSGYEEGLRGALLACPGLEELRLANNRYDDPCYYPVCSALAQGACPGLKKLDLCQADLASNEVDELCRALTNGHLRNLGYLAIGWPLHADLFRALAHPNSCRRLHTLNLRPPDLGLDGVHRNDAPVLAEALIRLPELESLSLSSYTTFYESTRIFITTAIITHGACGRLRSLLLDSASMEEEAASALVLALIP